MSKPPLRDVSVLVASPSAEERARIVALVRHAESDGALFRSCSVTEAKSAGQARELLGSTDYSICLLGAALGETEQEDILRDQIRSARPSKPLMVPLLEKSDQPTLMRFIQAGARGILLAPVSAAAFVQVLHTAFEAGSIHKAPVREEVANLPWVLEHISHRVAELAERIKERESASPVPADAKLVKEALLGIIGTSNSAHEESLDQLAEFLLRVEQ